MLETSQEVHKACTVEQIRACYRVMHQLRPHFLLEKAFIEQVERQQAQGYHLLYIAENEEVQACAGFRFLEFLVWGKVLYIDDLITDKDARRKGYGSTLLKYLIEQAKNVQCDQVHLDSGYQRHDAHRLYLNHGFKLCCHHFALELAPG